MIFIFVVMLHRRWTNFFFLQHSCEYEATNNISERKYGGKWLGK